MVELRFKPADVGTVGDGTVTEAKLADGAVTNVKVNASAAIAKSKLAALNIVNADVDAGAAIAKSKLEALAIGDADVNAITVTKVTGAVDGRKASTTGDKDVLAIGFDAVTEEIVVDREA